MYMQKCQKQKMKARNINTVKNNSFSLDDNNNNNERETQKELHLYVISNILGNVVFYLHSNVMENAGFKPCQGYKYFTL